MLVATKTKESAPKKGVKNRLNVLDRPDNELVLLYADDFRAENWIDFSEDGLKITSWGDCMTYVLTGHRGDGKSLLAATLAAQAMIAGCKVISNMAIGFRVIYPDEHIQVCRSLPLDMQQLMKLDDDIAEAVVIVDEVQNWLSNRTWASVRNRVINLAIAQIRKLGDDMVMTCKAINWLDPVFRGMELDVEAVCHDCHSFNANIPKGISFKVDVFDRSGTWTGKENIPGRPNQSSLTAGSWNSDGMFNKPNCSLDILDADRIWHIYDSYEKISFMEAMRPLKIDLEPEVIGEDGSKTTSKQATRNAVRAVVDEIMETPSFRQPGTQRKLISVEDFAEILQDRYNVEMDTRQLLPLLRPYGVKPGPRGDVRTYDFQDVEVMEGSNGNGV